MTLEFLSECIMGYGKSEQGLRYLCLLYMIPWLPNLALYCGRSPEDQAKTKNLLRLLIDLTLTGEVCNIIFLLKKNYLKIDIFLSIYRCLS